MDRPFRIQDEDITLQVKTKLQYLIYLYHADSQRSSTMACHQHRHQRTQYGIIL